MTLLLVVLAPAAIACRDRPPHARGAGGHDADDVRGPLRLPADRDAFAFAYGVVDHLGTTPFFAQRRRGPVRLPLLQLHDHHDHRLRGLRRRRPTSATRSRSRRRSIGQIYLVTVVAVIVGNLAPAPATGRWRLSGRSIRAATPADAAGDRRDLQPGHRGARGHVRDRASRHPRASRALLEAPPRGARGRASTATVVALAEDRPLRRRPRLLRRRRRGDDVRRARRAPIGRRPRADRGARRARRRGAASTSSSARSSRRTRRASRMLARMRLARGRRAPPPRRASTASGRTCSSSSAWSARRRSPRSRGHTLRHGRNRAAAARARPDQPHRRRRRGQRAPGRESGSTAPATPARGSSSCPSSRSAATRPRTCS